MPTYQTKSDQCAKKGVEVSKSQQFWIVSTKRYVARARERESCLLVPMICRSYELSDVRLCTFIENVLNCIGIVKFGNVK
jgi:hypothetical protein